MRKKFFVIIFVFLVASSTLVFTLSFLFFDSERMRFLDQRLETIASTLIASGLSLSFIENLDSTDDLVHDLLGEERIDQIINVYNLEGELLAQNFTGSEIPLDFNAHERRETVTVKDRSIRVLNFPSGRIMIQVGMFFNPSLIGRMDYFDFRNFLFLIFLLTLLAIVAYYSSGILFRPLRELTRELRSMSQQLERKLGQSLTGFVIGPQLNRLAQGHPTTKDEFEQLCWELTVFLKKLEDYTKSFHAQTALLTHELKTPLTLMRNYLSEIKKFLKNHDTKFFELSNESIEEVDHLTKVINDFLQWSVLTSNPNQPTEIHAVKLQPMIQKIVYDFNQIHNSRIQILKCEDITVFALPDHVRQLILNLLTNSLNYSQDQVELLVGDNQIQVNDRGPGIPESVLENLGSPFNRGPASHKKTSSTGLGLAWVHSLCEKYHWILDINSSSEGTKIIIQFPSSS